MAFAKSESKGDWQAASAEAGDKLSEKVLDFLGVASVPCLKLYDCFAGLVGLTYMAPTGTPWYIWVLSSVINIITSGIQHVFWKQMVQGGIFAGFSKALEKGQWVAVLRVSAFLMLCFIGMFFLWILDSVLDTSFTLVLFPQPGFTVQDVIAVSHPQGWWLWEPGHILPSFNWATFKYPASTGYYLWTILNAFICSFGEPVAEVVKAHYTGQVEFKTHSEDGENPPKAPVSRSGANNGNKDDTHKSSPTHNKKSNPKTTPKRTDWFPDFSLPDLFRGAWDWFNSDVSHWFGRKPPKKTSNKKPSSEQPPHQEIKPNLRPMGGYVWANGSQKVKGKHLQLGHVLHITLDNEPAFGLVIELDTKNLNLEVLTCEPDGTLKNNAESYEISLGAEYWYRRVVTT